MIGTSFETDIETGQLEEKARKELCRKTVNIFRGVTGKDIEIVYSSAGPCVSGTVIDIDHTSSNFYEDLEHEIAHILFKSDGTALDVFADTYVAVFEKKYGRSGSNLKSLIVGLANVAEDYRVNELWGMIYPGSSRKIKEQDRTSLVNNRSKTRGLVGTYLGVSLGLDSSLLDPSFVHYREDMEKALASVRGKGFGSTLRATRWLLAQIAEDKAKTDNTSKEEALSGMAARSGYSDTQELPDTLSSKERKSTVREGFEGTPGEIPDDDKVDSDMNDAIVQTLEAISNRKDETQSNKEYTTLELIVKGEEPSNAQDLEWSDGESKKLRNYFSLIQGRRTSALSDDGNELDVASYIQRVASGTNAPCYKVDTSGRGFKCVILLDKSGSMSGARRETSEKACFVLKKALSGLPYVDLEVVGWCSRSRDLVLYRYDRSMHYFTTKTAQTTGGSPLSAAIEEAGRIIGDHSGYKVMLAITDGEPNGISHEDPYVACSQALNSLRRKGVKSVGVLIGEAYGSQRMRKVFGKDAVNLDTKDVTKGLVTLVKKAFVDYLRG